MLRPTEAMRALVDVEAMADRHAQPERGYSRPYVATLLKWLDWGTEEIDWIADQPDLFDRWDTMWGLDFGEIPVPDAVTWSPVMGHIDHTDIGSEGFWDRDLNCSSRTAWSMIWGAYAQQGESVRQELLGDWEAVAAIDSVSPGQLGWWLVDQGWAEIVLIASDPDYP